jgi:Domain of unknown function (DUF4397)
MKRFSFIAACIVLLLVAGCKSGGGANSLASLRVVNAAFDSEPLDVLIADSAKASAVAAGSTAPYNGIPVGTQDVKIRSSTNGAILLEKNVAFGGGSQTLVIYGRRASLNVLLQNDDTSGPSSGKAKIRAINLSPEASPVDVYFGTTDLASTAPAVSQLAFGAVADFQEVNGGTSILAYTTAGTKDVRFQVNGQTFTAGNSYTVMVFPSAGGQLVNAVVLTGGGGGTFIPNTFARVKAVNSMADGTVATFKADGTTLLSNVPYAAASSYVNATADNHTLSIEAANVPGVTIASTTQALAPARDYSMIAIGDANQPALAVLADENFVPATGTARVRFVNALSGSNTVDVLVNFASQVSGLAPRSASAYYTLGPSTTYTVTFANPGGIGVIATLTPLEIDSGLVYSIYLLGSPAAPRAILVRDR